MQTLCQHLRKRIDASPARYVALPVEEIKLRAPSGFEGAHEVAWWCDVMRDPSHPVCAALRDNGLHCLLDTDCGEVVTVGFF